MKNDKLVIVESPTKAKTIAKLLGKGYVVLSSFGHIRDLPKKELGVDVEHNFTPKYVVPTKSRKIASELKKAASKVKEVYFASDEDREGEAIAWHLSQLLDLPKAKTKRISFHEITGEAIKKAIEEPRDIDIKRVDAQQARRILDRLVGYKLSPFLWKKVARGLSAGRVQSVIVRLIVEREREISAFKPKEYWTIEALLTDTKKQAELSSKLTRKDGKSLDKFAITTTDDAHAVINDLENASWKIAKIERRKVKRTPPAPFTTSTLQQDAINKLGFSAKQTMMLAQQLYEGVELGEHGATGLITYMRTDSVTLSEKFITEAREFIGTTYGNETVPENHRMYKTKTKRAQEAHEAIRPTSAMRTPEDIASHLDSRQRKLYELIWRRALASQMIDAELETVSMDINATSEERPEYTFRATGSTIKRKGFLDVYTTEMKETLLPELSEGEEMTSKEITPKQHFTEPPPRYTEASLVKTLEENGIGRPSTYAPTISTVVDRGYVEKEERKLKPTELATLVNDLLVKHFKDIVDIAFTAHMEEALDDISEGKKDWIPIIRDFYIPFEKNLEKKDKEVSKKEITEEATDEVCEKCGKPMISKIGRYGKFLACTGFPECRNTKTLEASEENEGTELEGEKCPKCDADMMIKRSRFGKFLSCSRYPDCKTVKSILKKVGAKCPECKEGDIIEKKTRKGKPFYACSRYPDCDHALWSKPTGKSCPECGDLLIFAKGDSVKCAKKTCTYTHEEKES